MIFYVCDALYEKSAYILRPCAVHPEQALGLVESRKTYELGASFGTRSQSRSLTGPRLRSCPEARTSVWVFLDPTAPRAVPISTIQRSIHPEHVF